MSEHDQHYLREELYALVRTDPSIFGFLQSGSLDGIWYWDLENPDNEWLSPRFWEIFGYDPEQKKHLASEWQDMIHPEDLQTALANFNAHCADPSHPYDQLVRYTHKDGSTVWVRCRGLAIRDDNGKPIRMLGAHNEVTELMEARQDLEQTNAELRRANAVLERANAELEQFAYVASHDLRQPLHTIETFAALLREEHGDQLDEDGLRYVDFQIEAAARLQGLIDGLLRLSRVAFDPSTRATVSLTDAATLAQADLGAVIAESGARIECEALPSVPGDPDLLRQVFSNLFDNAIKYRSEATPEIRVACQPKDVGVHVTVKDNGIGFDPNQSERIFRVFQRLHPAGSYSGAGIGLSIVARIVTGHGGRLWAESEPGVGSTFHVTLPLQASNSNGVAA